MNVYIGKMPMVYCLNVFLKLMQIESSMSFMKENVDATSIGKPLLIKSLELVTTSPPSFKMSTR